MQQILQWVCIFTISLLYTLQVTGWGSKLWSSLFGGGSSSRVGPRLEEPEWVSGLKHMLQVASDSAEEGRKMLYNLSAKRPHLDLIPDVKTSTDILREHVEQIRSKVMDGMTMITTAARESERSQMANIQAAVGDVGKGQATLSGDFKQMGPLIQESARLLKGTHGLEPIFQNVTGVTHTVKQVGQNLSRLFGGELQELKNTTARLEEQNATMHAKFGELESKVDRMLEILEEFNLQATPSADAASPTHEVPPHANIPENASQGAQATPSPSSPSSTPVQVPPYTPSVPTQLNLATAIGEPAPRRFPPPVGPGSAQAGIPDPVQAMHLFMEMWKILHMSQASAAPSSRREFCMLQPSACREFVPGASLRMLYS